MTRLRSHGWLLVLFVIASFTMLWRLDQHPYERWDESIHGEVSYEMVEQGSWLTPLYTNGPYFRKPPLKLWVSAALFQWFGVNPWTLRLPSAVSGILVVLITGIWMWEWRRSRIAALLAGTILATSPAIFHHAFRTGEVDGMYALFVVAALYCWWKATKSAPAHHVACSEESRTIVGRDPSHALRMTRFWKDPSHALRMTRYRWVVLTGVFIGLGVMTKSVAGLLPLPIIAIDFFAFKRWHQLPPRAFLVPCLLFLILILPWHLAMSFTHGMTFWNDYLGWHVIHRFTTPLHNDGAGTWWYIGVFRRLFSPYAFWFLAATGYTIWEVNTKRSPTRILLLTWFAIGFLGFSATATKLGWYLLPLYPAAAMLIASSVLSCWRHVRTRYLLVGVIPLVILTFIMMCANMYTNINATYAVSPFPAIANLLTERQDGLVAYGFLWNEVPDGYFTMRSSLPSIRISDGLSDPERTLEKLALKERSWLITKSETELPQELRIAVGDGSAFGAFTLYAPR